MSWTMHLEGWLPMNTNKRDRAHWGTRTKELGRVVGELGWQQLQQRIPAATGPRRVLVTIVKSKRSHRADDRDNLHARAKSILDALVFLRMLVDDNPEQCHLEIVEQAERADTPSVRIELEDVTA